MSDGRRSVVLVTIDSLRADHCGYVTDADVPTPRGSPTGAESPTPTLDAMAETGTAFTTAIAPGPSTYESLPAILTGRPMGRPPLDGEDALRARTDRIATHTRHGTVVEWFDDRGYETAAFTTNPYTARHTNFARGFDRYEDFLDGGESALMRWAAHRPVLAELKHVVTLLSGDRASKPWQAYVDDVRGWLADAAEPFFLWVFLLDPHTPYLPPARFRDRGRPATYYHNWRLWAAKKWGLDAAPDPAALRELYRGAVRSADAFLGALREALADRPGDPVVCVHADHGEAFGEHGTWGHEGALYEENVHVPLVLAGGPDSDVDRPVPLTAIPRLLRAAARETLPAALADVSPGYALARSADADRLAVRGLDWKYLADADAQSVSDETVFDLAADPEETLDRREDHPDLAATCRRLARRRLVHERELAAVAAAAGRVEG